MGATVLVVGLLIGISLLLRPPAVGPPLHPPGTPTPVAAPIAPGAWTATGEMLVGRYDHSATLMHDGRVLVAGGRSSFDDDVLASAELFDPKTGSWSPAADMLTPTADHVATLLLDGRVLVVGDTDSELYDPDSDSWRAAAHIASSGPVPSPGPATLLADGRVLVITTRGTPRLYDPADDSWSLTGPMVTPRYNHMATLLADGSVLVVGGDIPPDVGLVSTELYDPATNTWMAMGETARPRTHVPTLLPDGRVLDVGWTMGAMVGRSGSCTTLTTGRGDNIDIPLPFRGSGADAPLLPDGRVLFVSLDGDTALYDSALRLCGPSARRWSNGAGNRLSRSSPTAMSWSPEGTEVAFTVGPPWACRQPSCFTLAPANECGSAL